MPALPSQSAALRALATDTVAGHAARERLDTWEDLREARERRNQLRKKQWQEEADKWKSQGSLRLRAPAQTVKRTFASSRDGLEQTEASLAAARAKAAEALREADAVKAN
mgnify:CR=1 FL=1